MQKISKKKLIIFGSLAGVSLVLGGLYMHKQIKNALKYSYEFSRFVVNKISFQKLDFNLFFNIKNPSKLKYTIKRINIDVLVDSTLIASIINENEQLIAPQATTEIGVNVDLTPAQLAKSLGEKWTTILANAEKIGDRRMVLKMNFKIGYLGNFLSVNVPYEYSFPLKDIFSKK
jgi:LEA14-like dessication related protein